MFDIPASLRARLDYAGFFDPLAIGTAADVGPPDASAYEEHDRFRAAYVRYAVRLGDIEKVPAALGRSWKQILRYLRGGAIPRDVLHALATGASISIDWLLSGSGPEQAFPGVVPIQSAAIRPSAGGGSELVESPAGTVPIPRILLDRLMLRPSAARLLAARGSSMLPTIDDGDWMIIDVSAEETNQPKSGLVYVLSIGDTVYVKRLFRVAGKWVMRSDNTAEYPHDHEVPEAESIRIIGRVRWVGRSL